MLVRTLDEQLTDLRKYASGYRSDGFRNDRDISPGDRFGSVCTDGGFEYGFFADRAEDHGDAVFSSVRKSANLFAEERIWDLQEEPRAVTGFGVVSGRAAVHEAFQHGESVQYDVMRCDVVQVGNESDSAGVVFELSIIHSVLSVFLHSDTPFP